MKKLFKSTFSIYLFIATVFLGSIFIPTVFVKAAAVTNFKVMAWNLAGEAFFPGNTSGPYWTDISRSISEIINIVTDESPSLVVFDAVHSNFENQLKQAMVQKGYNYSYIQSYLPTTNPNFKKAIFSKYSFISTDAYTATGITDGGEGENYAARNQTLKVKVNISGNIYSFLPEQLLQAQIS